MKKQTFSIITPCYNGEAFIQNSVNAILNCGYDLNCIEHIIVDDGSSDRTKEMCENLAKQFSHIKFYSKTNGNWGSVINYVKNNHLAHNDYVLVCDIDDAIVQGAFEKVNNKINKMGVQPDLFIGSFYLWNGKNKKTKVYSYYFQPKSLLVKKRPMQYYSPLILPFSTFMKNEIFYSIPDLREGISYQDSILYANAFLKAKTIGVTTKAFVKYWKVREGNTMSVVKTEKGMQNQMLNLEYFSQHDLLESFFYQIVGMPNLRKYLIKNNIKYSFNKKKPDLSGFPWFTRWILYLMFKSQTRKIIKK